MGDWKNFNPQIDLFGTSMLSGKIIEVKRKITQNVTEYTFNYHGREEAAGYARFRNDELVLIQLSPGVNIWFPNIEPILV